jgi:hypothetical protein
MVNNNNWCSQRPPTEKGGRERVMETGLLGWVGLGMDTAEVAMLGAILLLLFRVHRNIARSSPGGTAHGQENAGAEDRRVSDRGESGASWIAVARGVAAPVPS